MILVVENEFLAEIEELKRANKIAEEKELANKALQENKTLREKG